MNKTGIFILYLKGGESGRDKSTISAQTNEKGWRKMAEYMGTSKADEKWGCTQDKVSRLCRQGKVKGAEQDGKGKPWRIPEDAPNPLIIK